MPCWAELEDQFEMDCSRQGGNDTQCSAHLLSLFCFLHSSLSLTAVISFFLSYLLLSLSLVSHIACFHHFASVLPYLCLPPAPLTFSSQGRVDRGDRVVFVTSGTNPCRVMRLQDSRDNSSGLVMHITTEESDIDQCTNTEKRINIYFTVTLL